jgi:hypothetical protein
MFQPRKRIRINPRINRQNLPRTIPTSVKLEVRRRCGFGCVICGLGIYEYEHFSPEFKHATSHDANGITLLCPNHHTRKTRGLLSKEKIIRHNLNPEALKKGFVKDEIDINSENLVLVMGTLSFSKTPIAIQIGDEPILSIVPSGNEDEPYQLSVKLRDRDGNIILEIDNNEWKTTTSHWDCKTIGNRLQIRSAPRKIELIIRHMPPNELHIERLSMKYKGYMIEAHENQPTKFINSSGYVISLQDARIDNFEVGVHLHLDGGIELGKYARGGGSSASPCRLRTYHISSPPSE